MGLFRRVARKIKKAISKKVTKEKKRISTVKKYVAKKISAPKAPKVSKKKVSKGPATQKISIKPSAAIPTTDKLSQVIEKIAPKPKPSKKIVTKAVEPQPMSIKPIKKEEMAVDPRTGRPYGLLTKPTDPKGFLEKALYKAQQKRAAYTTSGLRGERAKMSLFEIGKGIQEEVVIRAGKPILETLIFGKQLITHPIKTTTGVYMGLKELKKEVVAEKGVPTRFKAELARQVREEPLGLVSAIGGELLVDYATGTAVSKGAGLVKRGAYAVAPDAIKLGKTTTKAGQIARKLDIPIDTEDIARITIKERGVPTKPVREQVKLLGRDIFAVSAQADLPKKYLRGKKLVRELFFDPEATARKSRLLPKQAEAGLKDILTGEFTLKKTKPAIIFKEVGKVADIPEGYKSKLLRETPLSKKELRKVMKLQETPSGEFKGLGRFTKERLPTRELEVTLPAGERLFAKRVGRAVIDKKPTKVFRIERIGDVKGVRGLISRGVEKVEDVVRMGRRGKVTRPSTMYGTSSRTVSMKPYLSPVVAGAPLLGGISSLLRPRKKTVSTMYVPSKKATTAVSIPSPVKRRKPTTAISPAPSITPYSQPYTPTTTYTPRYTPTPTTPLPRILPTPKKRKREEKKPAYHVDVRESRPKGKARVEWVRVSASPLPRNKAFSLGADYADKTSAATFKLARSGFTKMKDTGSRRLSYKFRPKSRKSLIGPSPVFIEKNKYRIDTPGERQGITAKGLLAIRRKRGKKR